MSEKDTQETREDVEKRRKAYTEKLKAEIEEALPEGAPTGTSQKLVSVFSALTLEINNRSNPDAQQMLKKELRRKILECAGYGMVPNEPDGRITLTVSYNAVMLMMGYKGAVELCAREGWRFLPAVLVDEADEISVRFHDAVCEVSHSLNLSGHTGKMIGGYVSAVNGKEKITLFLYLDELDRIRSNARSQEIWKRYPNDMYKKSLVKKLAGQIMNLGYLSGVSGGDDFLQDDQALPAGFQVIDEPVDEVEMFGLLD